MTNLKLIKQQIRKFCFEKLKNNQEPLIRFEKLVNSNATMIENDELESWLQDYSNLA